jgi:mono/diheme cytochrome c family protein
MKQRISLALGLAFVASAMVLSAAWAGGWAVVTLDSIPDGMQAGVPRLIGFMVRQHGATPLAGLTPVVEARSTEGGSIRVEGEDSGPPGHYAAALTLPSPGRWTWGIRGFGDALQPMPALQVLPTGDRMPPAGFPLAPLFVAAGVAAAFGLFLLFRQRLRFAAATLGLSVVLGAAGFLTARPTEGTSVEAAAPSTAVAGQALFVAKGCVVCHVHDGVPESGDVSLSFGPELSTYHNGPEFLRAWLTDPTAVRPKTGMPDLGLSTEEIEALIGFLNQDG